METSTVQERCERCLGPAYDEMVQCRNCAQWYHRDCVDADDERAGQGWQCCGEETRRSTQPSPRPIQRPLPGDITREIEDLRRQLHVLEDQNQAPRGDAEPRFAGFRSSTRRYSTADDWHELTRSQIAARNVVSGKLPKFSGSPEDWTQFKSRFETSTRMCGFSDDENIMRLQECLTGRALRAVQCRLQHPENLHDVMSTLERMFGRPEVLIDNMLQKIRQTPAPKLEHMQSVVDFGIAVEELCAAVRTSGLHEYNYNSTLLQELVERLPPSVRLNWGLHKIAMGRPVTVKDFGEWIKNITDAAISVIPPPQPPTRKSTHGFVNNHLPPSERTFPNCMVCGKASCAAGPECDQLRTASVKQRWHYVQQLKLCRRCLWRHGGRCHMTTLCNVDGCTAPHHQLLHETETTRPRKLAASHSHISQPERTLLRYVPVILYGKERSISTYAFLDEGSSVTLMDHELAAELNLQGTHNPICLSWTGDQKREEKESIMIAVKISDISGTGKIYEMPKVHTVCDLALPRQSVPDNTMEQTNVKGYVEAIPRLLIGVDNYRLTCPLKVVEGKIGHPIATKTRLGWTICGPVDSSAGTETPTNGFHLCTCKDADARLNETLRGYFASEDNINDKYRIIRSKDDIRAMTILEATTKFVNGRYKTGLLWRNDNTSLPDNRKMAMNRLECLERRMQREEGLADTINEKLRDHLQKGYVRKLTNVELANRKHPKKWYLPIFPVMNPNKPNKLRLVWDAAAAVRGVSLNSKLLTGPDLLTSLPSVLYGFREYRIAIVADIREMYHQVMIRKEDEMSQCFLWRWGNPKANVEEFVMTRMTFGATCSPSCAQYIKNTNADRFKEIYPNAVRCIKEKHYVDDMLVSVELEEEAMKLATEVEYIHSQGGFELHNWISNSRTVSNRFGNNVEQMREIDFDHPKSAEKVLGMWWDRISDSFTFKLSPKQDCDLLKGENIPTKRQILRILMSIYDPLGLISGFLLYLKIILQEVWRSGTGWDERISNELHTKWIQWLKGLPVLEEITIPRCYRQRPGTTGLTIQLHVFVDAGRDGYAAVAYFRFENKESTELSLVGGKAKVAPLKYMSVPRMELQAAVIGARIATNIRAAHDLEINQSFLWTDSRDVMCWINSDHRKYSPFVAHRVAEILERTNIKDWRWVPTKLNVADECTKWTNLEQHIKSSRWFSGPDFLRKSPTEWPPIENLTRATEEEARKCVAVHEVHETTIIFERFSRWRRLIRAVGYVWRFVNNARNPETRNVGPLTSSELQQAELSVLQEAQRQAYPDECKRICGLLPNGDLPVKKGSKLYKRSPYVDENGIIRVRGRIDACAIAEPTMKRPIILPKTGTVTELIVEDVHRRYRHVNHETVVNEVRLKYDIPALRRVCRKVRKNCLFCRIRETNPSFPKMGQLPPARLAAYARPFCFTGIDYFGPMSVSMGHRKSEKRWGVLFTCLTIRAVHIEVAHSLSTDACILAIRNFMVRRGTPNEIFSDCGTNFVGANKELLKAVKEIDRKKLIDEINIPYVKWSFNPPSAPHFGGSWERMIRTVKRTLERMPFHRLPTDAVLSNMLIEVEGIINSRPLTHVPLDHDDEAPLTPNHFLLGTSSGVKPLIPFDDSTAALKNTWKTAQLYTNMFWKKWMRTYLPTLTKRSKWHESTKEIEIGDLVLVIDENHPRSCWPRGRVKKTTKSRDGIVRRVTIKTAKGTTLERPAVKVIVLDVGPTKSATKKQVVARGGLSPNMTGPNVDELHR